VAVARPASTASASELPAAASAPKAGASAPTWLRAERDAWRELAQAWNVELGEGEPCATARTRQLHCYKTPSINLALIRELDRPGFLTVHDPQGRPAYALLTGLTPQEATLRSGGASHTVPLAALAESWRGDFFTFWRMPPGYSRQLAEGDSGAAVQWLSVQLAALRGEAASAAKATLDARLKARIHAFQLSKGLEADGTPGPMTFMQLNRAAGVDEPRLQQTEK
jgi:general secretion pathway protein A